MYFFRLERRLSNTLPSPAIGNLTHTSENTTSTMTTFVIVFVRPFLSTTAFLFRINVHSVYTVRLNVAKPLSLIHTVVTWRCWMIPVRNLISSNKKCLNKKTHLEFVLLFQFFFIFISADTNVFKSYVTFLWTVVLCVLDTLIGSSERCFSKIQRIIRSFYTARRNVAYIKSHQRSMIKLTLDDIGHQTVLVLFRQHVTVLF